MTKDLVEVKDKQEVALYEPQNLMMMLSSVGLPQNFKVMDETKLAFIGQNLPAVYREKEVYGRHNSQVTSKLMSLTMLKHGVFGALKQIGAQIENKRNALKENTIKLAKLKNDTEELEEKLLIEQDKYRIRNMELDIISNRMGLADARVAVEQTLREIYMFLQTRKEIMESKGIPEDFDEEMFVAAEIKENLMSAFQNAFRDVMQTGRLNVGTEEWLSQYGVHPIAAVVEINVYMNSIPNNLDIDHFYKWLDDMYDKYQDEWQKAAKRVGIKEIFTRECAYIEKKD